MPVFYRPKNSTYPTHNGKSINVINVYIGDNVRFDRQFLYPLVVTDLHDTVVSVQFVVKFDDRDEDVQAVINKTVTYTTSMPDSEYIRYYDNTNTFILRFALTSSQTSVLQEGFRYFYQIRYVTTSGESYVAESGILYGNY